MASNFPERQEEEENSQSSVEFSCEQCEKTYRTKDNLTRHMKANHLGVTFNCRTCEKTINSVGNRTRHEKSCNPSLKAFDCNICGKRCATEGGLRHHEMTHQGPSNASDKKDQKRQKRKGESFPAPSKPKKPRTRSKQFRCRRCNEVFDNRHDLWAHGMRQHYQVGGGLQPVPWGQNPAPWISEAGHVDADLREVYETNEPIILARDEPGPIISSYNFPVDNRVSVTQLNRFALEVYHQEQHAFRLNLAFGVILQNRETGEYRYFTPYANSMVLDSPVYISKRRDLRRLYLRLRRMDVLTELLRQRPDTKWIPVLITNVILRAYSTQYLLGMGQLPEYITKHKAIVSLAKNKKTDQPYNDQLCVFRCLALHRGYDVKSLEGATKELYRQWTKDSVTNFAGVSFDEFPHFEVTFKINLEVYRLDENGTAQSVYRSRGRYEETMYVNMYEHHLSYITHFAKYAKKFQCQSCERHFYRSNDLLQHQRSCSNKTKYVFPGGFFKSAQTIFEKLEEYDIVVPTDQRTFSWFIVYDFEAMLQKLAESATDNLKWTQKHVPISVSICSNVPGHEKPQCIVNENIDDLVKSMLQYMQDIGTTVRQLSEEKWGWMLKELEKTSNGCFGDMLGGDVSDDKLDDVSDDDDRNDEESEDETDDEDFGEEQTQRAVQNLYGQTSGYMNQVPVLGFNSARYDLNLIKQVVARHLNMHDKERSNFVVKKNNSYCCISTPDLKFLDIMQFLAPGTSYVKFLKACGVQEQKGFFPYEWFDDVSKLDRTELPHHSPFHSALKNTNISTEEYTSCQAIWSELNMITFRDFLEWYNNLDVGPFVKAVERFQEFYFQRGLDVLKTAISVPGIARQLLFKSAHETGANFALFDRFSEDLYHTFKHNIVSGASIIFNRRHVAGKTRIRGKKLCRKVVGFDANALYLWAIDQKMPVGPFIRRRADNDFRPEVRDKFMAAYFWMDWLNVTGQAAIKHKLNSGEEKRVGKFPVDGWDVDAVVTGTDTNVHSLATLKITNGGGKGKVNLTRLKRPLDI